MRGAAALTASAALAATGWPLVAASLLAVAWVLVLVLVTLNHRRHRR